MEDLTQEELTAALDRVAADILESAGVDEPPVDAIELATEHLGMIVRESEGRPSRRKTPGAVSVRRDAGEIERQWSAAKAVAESYKPTLYRRLGLDPNTKLGGSLTNRLARHILLPRKWFESDARDYEYDLEALQDRYGTVDVVIIADRIVDLPTLCIMTVLIGDRVESRKSNGPRVNRRLSPVEEQCRQAVEETGEPQALRSGAWSVQGWPVRSGVLDRIILRSEVDDSGDSFADED